MTGGISEVCGRLFKLRFQDEVGATAGAHPSNLSTVLQIRPKEEKGVDARGRKTKGDDKTNPRSKIETGGFVPSKEPDQRDRKPSKNAGDCQHSLWVNVGPLWTN